MTHPAHNPCISVTLTDSDWREVILALYGDAGRHWNAERIATAKALYLVKDRIEAQAPGLFDRPDQEVAA